MKNYTEKLKKYWKSESLSFIATFSRFKIKEGFFNDFINPVSLKTLFYPEFDGIIIENKKVSFYIPNAQKLKAGFYYKVDLVYSEKVNKKNNPYSLTIQGTTVLDQEAIKNHINGSINEDILKNVFKIKSIQNKDAAKKHIQLRFERLNNPEANKIIANLMREIGKGMYSSKQRMIFELLQNADDAPGKEKVEFHIDVNGDYFFVMHDGAPFSKDDVEAITSAAESTKRKDKKKTGYKGIGFKSVFTDSEEVWLKSGGYQFAFIRNSELFKDFESFYFSSSDYQEFPQLKEKHRLKYQKDISTYNSLTDIPWQVIPIWQDYLPKEFDDSNFSDFDNPVQFALKVGSSNIYSEDGYLNAIENIVKKPEFLLFLRNTSKFRSPKNRVTVIRYDDGQKIRIEKTRVEYVGKQAVQNSSSKEYLKEIYSGIPVDNEAFTELNIGLKKIIEKNDLNEDTFHFIDADGNKIETIPPKLAAATETEISFGLSLIDGKIAPEQEYKDELPKYSSLFTYLPMEDTRFQLPFLVNADFVPSSDRQRIQGDNLWNKYIMIKVAEKHVETLALLASRFQNQPEQNETYLSILLKTPLPDDDTAQHIIDSYNKRYQESLSNTKIVVNDKNELQLLSETILDTSGLIELFGNEFFYQILSTEKRLTHSNLENKYLIDYSYLNVESIDMEELAGSFSAEVCELLGNAIASQKIYEDPRLMKWLNELVKYIPSLFSKIPFIVHNNSLFSIERLIEETEAWIINDYTKDYEKLFNALGYHSINLDLDKYPNIKDHLHKLNGYLTDRHLAYERIASKKALGQLEVNSKIELIDFLQNSDFMLGVGETKYLGELALFVDESDTARPLQQLLSRESDMPIISLKPYRVSQQEYNAMPLHLKNALISRKAIFKSFLLHQTLFANWSSTYNSKNIENYVSDLQQIFSWVEDPDAISASEWASIPWLYTDDSQRFTTADHVYWSSAFNALSSDKYNSIKNIIHNAGLKLLPMQQCGALIKAFKLKTDDSSDINWPLIKSLQLMEANTLLDWLEIDGDFSDFFEKYTLTPHTDSTYVIQEINNVNIYDPSNSDIDSYIQSNEGLREHFYQLDINLCSDNRFKIGLLQGERLLKSIIDSGIYDQSLASLLPTNITIELLHEFVSKLPELSLKTEVEYNNGTPEHFILNSLIKYVDNINEIPNEISQTIDSLRNKITINDTPISNYNISDRVTFGVKENRMVLSLSRILEEFQGDSDELENVKEAFIHITQKEKLRKLIFRTRQLSPAEIHTKIESENNPYYTVYQSVFQILDNIHGGNRKWNKPQFDDYFKQQGDSKQLQKSYKEFFDLIYDLQLTEIGDFHFHGFDLSKTVFRGYAIDSELIPSWLNEWALLEESKRFSFLSSLGYQGDESPIVNLRKAMVSNSYSEDTAVRYLEDCKSNMQILWNTIVWLSDYNSDIITRNIGLIQRINNFIKFQTESIQKITIPVLNTIKSDGIRYYLLKPIEISQDLNHLSIQADFSNAIFSAINDGSRIIVDESIGNLKSYFTMNEIEITEHVDGQNLKNNSKLWDEGFYQKWEYADDYSIFIYDGQEVPYFREYDGIRINEFTSDLKVCYQGRYYVSQLLKSDILNNLPAEFPHEKLELLKNWHYKTLQNESLLDEDSFEYKEDIDRLIQNRLGISEEDQKRESGNAKTHAVYFLDENGYDVSQVNNAGSALTNIVDPNGNHISCIVRSAKGGLLYLDKEHWDMLVDNAMYLVVIYPGNSPRLFKDRLELLEEELAENVLFRIPNNKLTDEIDGVFDTLESESHLILVTSEKMRESLFSKLKKKRTNSKENNSVVAGDNFSFD
ncbi:MAG: ATP-binding protein [Bacteroidetes bacterium]|nr:ATP-binding protein [Bacteroidota bacterium]